jgi:hypothetical protein
LVLEDEEKDRQQALRPMVTYEGVKFPIYLDVSSQIKLSVEQGKRNPVVRVEEDGTVHALRAETNLSVEQNEENPIMRVHEDGRVHGVAATSEILR